MKDFGGPVKVYYHGTRPEFAGSVFYAERCDCLRCQRKDMPAPLWRLKLRSELDGEVDLWCTRLESSTPLGTWRPIMREVMRRNEFEDILDSVMALAILREVL